jgi:Holliday junction resolvase RusA-like endonuclease
VPRVASISDLVTSIRKKVLSVATAAALSFSLALEPVPASRPRVGKWGVYYSKGYAGWMKKAQPLADKFDGPLIEGPIFVVIEQVCERPKTSKRDYPRGDVDNFAKGPLDIFTKTEKFWKDDDQVVGLSVFKRFAEEGEQPRTDVWWFPLEL